MRRPELFVLTMSVRMVTTLATILMTGACLNSCSEEMMLLGNQSTTKQPSSLVIDNDADGSIDEPVSVSGTFLTFECFKNPETQLNNQLIHCGFENESGVQQKLNMVTEVSIPNLPRDDFFKQESTLLNFQWDIWFPADTDLTNLKVIPLLDNVPKTLKVKVYEIIKDMPEKTAELILANLEDYIDEDNDYFSLTPSPQTFDNVSGFFHENEPNNDGGIDDQQTEVESCLTMWVRTQPRTLGRPPFVTAAWNDESCAFDIRMQPFACQHNFNPMDWVLSERLGNPATSLAEGDPCPQGYHWDHPDTEEENEEVKRLSRDNAPANEQFQVWLNLKISGRDTDNNVILLDHILKQQSAEEMAE